MRLRRFRKDVVGGDCSLLDATKGGGSLCAASRAKRHRRETKPGQARARRAHENDGGYKPHGTLADKRGLTSSSGNGIAGKGQSRVRSEQDGAGGFTCGPTDVGANFLAKQVTHLCSLCLVLCLHLLEVVLGKRVLFREVANSDLVRPHEARPQRQGLEVPLARHTARHQKNFNQ